MSKISEEEIQKILPEKGPSFEEVKNYLEKYNNEYIVVKCGGSVLVNQDLFNNFINDISILNKLGFIPIIIHGGGKRISNKLKRSAITCYNLLASGREVPPSQCGRQLPPSSKSPMSKSLSETCRRPNGSDDADAPSPFLILGAIRFEERSRIR